MPYYSFKCPSCHTVTDQLLPVENRNNPQICMRCGNDECQRSIAYEHVNARNDYEHTVYSEAMGVTPAQIPEAKKKFPHHEFTSDGRMVIRNTEQLTRVRKDLGWD